MRVNAEECLSSGDNLHLQSDVPSVLKKGRNCADAPLFSIVIPVYRRLETLKESVEAALGQDTACVYDIIVVEDNPESGTPVEDYLMSLDADNLKYYKNSGNLGLVGNFNRILTLADGEYVVVVHDDDILSSFYLKEMERLVRIRPDADIIMPEALKWREDKGEPKPSFNYSSAKARLWKPCTEGEAFERTFQPTGVTIKRSSIPLTGGFDYQSGPSTDLYFIVRAGRAGVRYYKYDKPLFIYRWLENESLKLQTRLDFISAGIPLRRCILDVMKLPGFIADAMLRHYCDVAVGRLREDFPEINPSFDGLVLSRNRFSARFAFTVNALFRKCLLLRRLFAPKV